MKTNSPCLIGAMALTLMAGPVLADEGHSHSATDVSEHRGEKMDAPTLIIKAYATTIASKNVDELSRYVASEGKDFTIFEGSGANYGWADYRDHHLAPEFANTDLVFHTYKFNDIVTHTLGDMAYSTFAIEMAYTYKGEDKSRTGRGTAILKRYDDGWKIVHMHTS